MVHGHSVDNRRRGDILATRQAISRGGFHHRLHLDNRCRALCITTFLNPNKREASHLAAAHGFDKVNNDARVFWSVECWLEESETILTSKLRELIDRKNELNGKSPQIPDWAYKKAKKGIEDGEADFKVDQKPSSPALPDQTNQQPPAS
jgi:hypothetical protein